MRRKTSVLDDDTCCRGEKNQRKKVNIWLVGKRVIAKAIKIQFEQRPKEDREEAL